MVVTVILLFNMVTIAGEIKVNINQDQPQSAESLGDGDEYKEFEEFEFDVEDLGGLKANGGAMLGVLDLNLVNLNNKLELSGFDVLPEQMVLTGGGGLAGIASGSRFGGYGVSGVTASLADNGQKATLKLNYGGILYEKGVYRSGDVDIAIGSLIGGGTASLDLLYGQYSDLATPTRNIFKKDFMVIGPRINLHYQIAAVMGIDLYAGYIACYDFGVGWKSDQQEVNIPLNNLSAPMAGFQVSFGF